MSGPASEEVLDLAVRLVQQAEWSGDLRQADAVIALLGSGETAQEYPEAGATYWTVLGMALHIRFELTGDTDALRRSVMAFRVVADGISPDEPRWPTCVSNLANALVELQRATAVESALDEAVDLLRSVRVRGRSDDPNRAVHLLNLGTALSALATARGDLAAADEGMEVLREALAIPGADLDPMLLSNLGNALAERAGRTADQDAIAEAVDLYERAVGLAEPGDPHRPLYLSHLGSALVTSFDLTGELDSLRSAVAVHRMAVAAAGVQAADRPHHLSNLATALVTWHEFTADLAALEEALSAVRLAVEATPVGHADRPGRLLNLGVALGTWFGRHGDTEVLDEAVTVLRAALSALPSTHIHRATAQSALGEALTRAYEFAEEAARLDEAVTLLRESVSRTASADAALGSRLSNLAGALLRRFERVGHVDSLDEAVETARRSVTVTSEGHPARALRLSGLGSLLSARYVHAGDEVDLDSAIDVLRAAVLATGEGEAYRSIRLSALGSALVRQHLAGGERAHLDEAVAVLQQAVAGVLDDNPQLPAFRSNLANALRRRYELDGSDQDADDALELFRQQRQTGAEHPNHAAYQFNLAAVHRVRYRRTGDRSTAADAVEAFLAAARVRSAPTLVRAQAAVAAGRIAGEVGLARLAAEGFARAVALLDQLAWRGLPRDDQEELLRRFSGVGANAAAWALECGDAERAVELLERGRGVLLAQTIDARSPYDELHATVPLLAERIAWLRAELDRADPSPFGGTDPEVDVLTSRTRAERRMELAAEYDTLMAQANEVAGAHTVPRFADLRLAAVGGPVIMINISRYRCDAMIVTSAGVQVLRLAVTVEDVTGQSVTFVDAADLGRSAEDTEAEVLRWLFDTVAGPALKHLGLDETRDHRAAPRVWWCLTGLLSFLPLHAAAPGDGGPGVVDRVVSSYTPTLRALLHARTATPVERPEATRFLVVDAAAPQARPLPATTREVRTVLRWLPTARVLARQGASTGAVLDAMAEADWVHLTCHGKQDPTAPSRGHVLMHDGELTVRRLAQRPASRGGLAVLMACETVRGGVELADEAITVASAVGLGGFQHVVGTLWSIPDSVAARFAGLFYAELDQRATGGRPNAENSARAVHAAALALRARYGHAVAWAPFVHQGP